MANLRKILRFQNILGVTLPKEYTNALDLDRGDYVEVFLGVNKNIIIKKHIAQEQKITLKDQ